MYIYIYHGIEKVHTHTAKETEHTEYTITRAWETYTTSLDC